MSVGGEEGGWGGGGVFSVKLAKHWNKTELLVFNWAVQGYQMKGGEEFSTRKRFG